MKFTKNSFSNNRRKLLYWAAGTLSGLVLWRFNKKEVKPESPGKPVKMLTEDGQLVEVDPRFLGGASQKLKPKEIQTWVKHKL